MRLIIPISWFSVEVLSSVLTLVAACACLHAFSNQSSSSLM